MWRNPVGDGAKRTTTDISAYTAIAARVLRHEDMPRRPGESRDPSIRRFQLLLEGECRGNKWYARAAARWTPTFAGATNEWNVAMLMPAGWEYPASISMLGQRMVAKHLAQAGLHDFAGRGMRQFVEHYRVVWQHPTWEA